MLVRFGNAKRRYVAAILGRSTEFLISIALIGQLVTERLSVPLVVWTIVVVFILVAIGTWLTPEE